MNDPLPRIPSIASPLTFGISDPNAPRTIRDEDHAFVRAMLERGVTAISTKEPQEK